MFDTMESDENGIHENKYKNFFMNLSKFFFLTIMFNTSEGDYMKEVIYTDKKILILIFIDFISIV